MNKAGLLSALGAFVIWGFLPIYWKLIAEVPALETLAHRIVWSLVFLILVLWATGNVEWLRPTLRDKRKLTLTLIASVTLSINWGLFIWAVNVDEILSASLGYYINPLLSVLIGVLFFGEKLRIPQYVSIGFAACGVAWLTWTYGELPWIGLVLAFSFALYGALKKMAVLGTIEGLALETAGVFLPAVGYLIYLGVQGDGSLSSDQPFTSIILIGTGVATAVPLLMFAAAAQRIPLTMVGMMQYIAPTLQLLLGIFLYGESFPAERLIGFALIWIALILFTTESLWQQRRSNTIPAVIK